ncbi:MAG: hypothetical protein DM484_15775 [Candidatus Methylumidiphilus alinenensis]|uniref:DNA 5'-3' helicase n=1 Tax=Candidatus Methylumidiphilus alinenensis TaxID=2202197 RepID=A0A2W4R102_9GAMM|nr:MAG: hypothetical protein DM484_15775 [Candidatus Methylumidiphilus alinenensis]
MQPIPHDVQAEKALLVTMAYADPSGNALLFPRISDDCFIHPNHRVIFQAMKSLAAGGLPVDPLAIWTEAQRMGKDGRLGGSSEVFEFFRTGEEVQRPEVLVDSLNSYRHRRELIHLADHLSSQAYDLTLDPTESIHEAQTGLHRVSLDGRKDDGESWEEIASAMQAGEKFRVKGLDSMGHWGITTLDSVAPIPSGEYVTVGARPGVGKTALMTQIAVESARRGLKTLVVTMELSRVSMRARLASYIAMVPVQTLKRGDYTRDHVREVANCPNILANGRIQSPSPGIPWAKLDAMIRYEVDKYGIQLVLLDQFDKIGRPTVGRGSSEAYSFGQVSTGIMALTKELEIGFVLLCQLKGDAEGREPTLADHADSDRPGKDPAVVVHLWRDKDSNLKAKIQKNRDGGWVGKRINLDFHGDCQRFIERENETAPVLTGSIYEARA